MTKPVNSAALLQQIAAMQPAASNIPAETQNSSEPTPDIEAAWIDSQVLDDLALLGTQQNFLTNLINGFREDCQHHLQHLRAAQFDDYLQLRESLHALKGSATEMGARRLATLCQQAESIKPDELAQGRGTELTGDIENALEQTLAALDNYLEQHPQQA
jgi:two-component system sensor histidine kinase RpfC